MSIVWEAFSGPGPTAMRAILAPGLELSVSYEGLERLGAGSPPYNVFVFGKRLKDRSESLDAAQARAERVAATTLKRALENLISHAR